MLKEFNDVQWLLQNATAGPYMVVVSTYLFSDVIEHILEKPDIVAGMLLHDNATGR